jgi:glyoxylase-like metal-dependent hydrolase (beta-lactamase superfamily II)
MPVGIFQCNCTVVACETTRQAIVVDPGDEPNRILEIVNGNGLDVTVVIHTHAHIDHIMGSSGVIDGTGAAARLHSRDRGLWDRVGAIALSYGIPTPKTPPLATAFNDGEVIRFGTEQLSVIHTPGHTPGSCCFLLSCHGGTNVLLSGDTLFKGNIGVSKPIRRHTLEIITTSICERLLILGDDTRVIPGHGSDTRIGIERATNPFLPRDDHH